MGAEVTKKMHSFKDKDDCQYYGEVMENSNMPHGHGSLTCPSGIEY